MFALEGPLTLSLAKGERVGGERVLLRQLRMSGMGERSAVTSPAMTPTLSSIDTPST